MEVSSAVYELLYYKNYQLRLGFLTYILSDGHFTPAPECPWKTTADFERECVLDSKAVVGKIPQSYYKCKIKNVKDIKTFRMCDTQVNIEKLTKSLDSLYSVLCPPPGTTAPVVAAPAAVAAPTVAAAATPNVTAPAVAAAPAAPAAVANATATVVTAPPTNSTNSTRR